MRIFVNQEHANFTDFTDDDVPPAAEFKLDDAKKLSGETSFELGGHKFRKVDCLSVFFEHVELDDDGEDELGEQCFINRIKVFGNVGKNYHTQY